MNNVHSTDQIMASLGNSNDARNVTDSSASSATFNLGYGFDVLRSTNNDFDDVDVLYPIMMAIHRFVRI